MYRFDIWGLRKRLLKFEHYYTQITYNKYNQHQTTWMPGLEAQNNYPIDKMNMNISLSDKIARLVILNKKSELVPFHICRHPTDFTPMGHICRFVWVTFVDVLLAVWSNTKWRRVAYRMEQPTQVSLDKTTYQPWQFSQLLW